MGSFSRNLLTFCYCLHRNFARSCISIRKFRIPHVYEHRVLSKTIVVVSFLHDVIEVHYVNNKFFLRKLSMD